jgi:MYXO-CTERM domain-containing protein
VSQATRALVIVALAGGVAGAESKQSQSVPPRPWTGYIRTPNPARTTGPAGVTSSKLVFVKRCTTNCMVHFDPVDDSRTGASSIAAEGTRSLSPFSQSTEVWNQFMSCVRETFAPFDIQITDVKPTDLTTPHFLHLVGGKPTELHPDYQGAGGVAPFDCGEIANAITYTFDVYGPSPLSLCWTASQEIAHAFGLEHEFLQKDPMTYLSGDEPKRFRDVDAPCGEYEVAPRCDCKSTPQNSYRHIVGMFGPGAPTPPELTVKNPVEGKPTQPGFTALAIALDDVRIERVELYADGVMVTQTTKEFPNHSFELETTDFGAGPHTLEIKAIDVQGVEASSTIAITQGPPCTADTVCTGDDVCVTGVCIPGPDAPGGLGSICQSDGECLSNRCADAGEAHKHCVDECVVANADSCPDDFTCLAAGAEGVCWPTPSGGCCDAAGAPQQPILLALGLGLLVLRRRRAKQ